MEKTFVCLGHAGYMIEGLFSGEKLFVDTTIRLEEKRKRCMYVNAMHPKDQCDKLAAVKVLKFKIKEPVQFDR